MRIIIDIDGEDITVRTEQTGTRPPASLSDTPPPEVARAAAALGAASAGAAPAEADVPLQVEGSSEAVEALADAVDDAGAGPFPPPGMSLEEVESEVDNHGDS